MANIMDAEQIAVNFVKAKKPDWEVEVAAVKRKGGGWIVKGSVSKKESTARTRSRMIENWIVEIEEETVVDCEFTPGRGFTIA